MRVKFILTILIASLFSATYVFAQEGHDHHGHKGSMMEHIAEDASDAVEVGNKICPVSGQEVGSMGPAVKVEHEGKIYNLCCAGCVAAFKEDPEKYIKVVDESMAAEEAELSAIEVGNTICPVSGHKIGSMGQAVQHEYKGKVYNLCCAGCIEMFEKDPEKYIKILEEKEQD